MLIDMGVRALCDTSSRCGLAMACDEGKCGPCTEDAGCAEGEACVLDHCVRQEHAECHSWRDCQSGALCVLSGYSSDPRGNRDMRAQCQAVEGQGAQPEATELVRGLPAPPPEVSGTELLDQVRKASGGGP
jgi:hypothetical protein